MIGKDSKVVRRVGRRSHLGAKGLGLATVALVCLCASPARPQAGAGTSAPQKDCFADYVANLKECKRQFSYGLLGSSADRSVLAACIDGAKSVLEDCLRATHP